jgi:hypothetical protein
MERFLGGFKARFYTNRVVELYLDFFVKIEDLR